MSPTESYDSHKILVLQKPRTVYDGKEGGMEDGLACQKEEDKLLSFMPDAKYSFVQQICFIP
jgi:hypothetical protein